MGDRYRDDRDSRYSPSPRRESHRWDRERMDEYARRSSRDRYEDDRDYYSPRPQRRDPSPRRERVVYAERERDEERSRSRFRYDYEDDRDRYASAMVHRPREDDREVEIEIKRRQYERGPPEFERPKFVRRQSSLDTYDRKPMPRYGDVARIREESFLVPRRRSPPRYREPPRYEDYEDIRIAERDRYGHEDFIAYREREISRTRRGDYEFEEREEIIDERPALRRGKTKMPARLVHEEILIELGYPFERENGTIIILHALDKGRIDEVIELSRKRNVRAQEIKTTTYIVDDKDSPPAEEKIVERRTEIIREVTPGAEPSPTVPRSVREWDVLSKKTSHHEDVSDSSSDSSTLAPTVRTRRSKASRHSHHSRARSVSIGAHTEIIIDNHREESATVRGGVGALIVPPRERKKSRDMQQEIMLLEAEKKALKLERLSARGSPHPQEIIRLPDRGSSPPEFIRIPDRGASPQELVVLEPPKEIRRDKERGIHTMITLKEKDDEVIEVRKDKRAPDPKILKGMLWTLT